MGISIGRGGISLSGGRGGYTWVPEFDLWDDFTTNEAAPLASPRTAEPGPGTLTLVDTEDKLSISGGALVCAGGKASPGYGDPAIYGASVARSAGRTLLAVLNLDQTNKEASLGWDSNQSSILTDGVLFNASGTLQAYNSAFTGNLDSYSASTDYSIAVALRGTGFFVYAKGGVFTDWMLVWVAASGTTANLYPVLGSTSAALDASTLRVLDLPAPFDTDYGLATNRIAGAVSAGATFVHEANCLIEFVLTTIGSAGFAYIDYRKQDDNNCWRIRWNSSGTLALIERVAGVDTERGSATSVLSNGHRIVVIADGTTIRVYSNNVLRITYASATNFATETDGELEALGTGGAVSDIVAWPRTLTGQAKTLLDAAIDA